MQCPKCGESSADGTVICPGCDFILDSSFLGDDILNEVSGQHAQVNISSGSDAIVFGDLDEPHDLMFSESTGSFLTADTLDVDRQIIRAPVYVGKSVQELMKPEAVLAQAADIEQRKSMLSPFEMHVLSAIDGKRPVARLRKKTGLSSDDLRIAVGMLAEKNAVVLVGTIAPPDIKNMLAGELDDDDDDFNDALNDGLNDGLNDPTIESTSDNAKLHTATKKSGEPPTKKSGDLPSKKSELPKFRLDSMDIPDEAVSKGAPSPWDGKAGSGVSAVTPASPAKPTRPASAPKAAEPARAPPAIPNLTSARTARGRVVAVGLGGAPDALEGGVKERAAGFFELAHVELNKGNRVRAHVYAKLAVETDPAEPKYQELLKTWQVASRAATTLEASLFADAETAEKQGNHHKALALMVQALDAAPSAAHIHNRMGLLLAMKFKKFSEASEHLMRACELEPGNVVYKNNLGKIIALAEARSDKPFAAKPEKGFLGKLKKALE